jgi:hypothetical protein
MPMHYPANSNANGKSGVSGPNQPMGKGTPSKPKHYGG